MGLPNIALLEKEMQKTPGKPETVALRPWSSGPRTEGDGTPVTIRPICPDDARGLQGLFDRLSPESIALRFLGQPKELPYEQARQLANVDYQKSMALVATREHDSEEHIIAVARYAVDPTIGPEVAEAAIVVEDEYQKQGLGTLLLTRLVAYAQAHGIRAFRATVRQDNIQIMRFVQHSGLPAESTLDAGVWDILVRLEPGADR
jgi:GNAT superfamily N-acetyltransferase